MPLLAWRNGSVENNHAAFLESSAASMHLTLGPLIEYGARTGRGSEAAGPKRCRVARYSSNLSAEALLFAPTVHKPDW
jgi:hypothetical protein